MVSRFVQDLNQSRTAKHHCKHNQYSWIYFKKQWTQNSNWLQLKHSNLITLNYCIHINHIIIHIITNTASFFNNSNSRKTIPCHTSAYHMQPPIHWFKVIKINVARGDKVFFCTASKKSFWGDFVPSSLFLLKSPSLKITQHWQKVEGWDIYLVLQGSHGKMNSLQKNTEFFCIPPKSFQVLFPHWRTFFFPSVAMKVSSSFHISVQNLLITTLSELTPKEPQKTTGNIWWTYFWCVATEWLDSVC